MSRSLRPVPVVVLLALALLASAVLGVLVEPAVPGTGGTALAAPEGATAGGTVCVTGAGAMSEEVDLLLVAVPGTPPAAGIAARAAVRAFGTSSAPAAPLSELGPLGPGGSTSRREALGPEGWLWVGWADRPVLAWQEWSTPGAPGQPGGDVASACLPVDPPVQTVLGLSTVEGDEALLRFANPFDADATFAVTLVTPTEVLEPVALRNVSVRGGTRTTLRLNDHAPEQRDLAAIVTVGAGRLAVEGLQRSVAAVGGVDGLASVPPVAAPAVAWTVPWLPQGSDVDGSAWILNPEPRPVVVDVTVHAAEGATVPEGTASLEVGPGALRRVDLADVAVDAGPDLSLTLRSQTTGVLVAAGGRFRSDDPGRTGLVRVAASPLPDTEWVAAGVAGEGRRTVLHLVNLSEQDVAPRIVLTTTVVPAITEEVGPEGDGPEAVTVELTPAPITAGAVRRIVLPLEGPVVWSAVVSGGPGLVVSRTTLGDERLAPVAVTASPSRTWRTVAPARPGRELEGWVGRLGTVEDLRREDGRLLVEPLEDVG